MAEAAFSVDGKYYSAITQDGRLRIWDTETNVLKQEYTPDLHLTSPPSCLQWISATQSANTQKGGRRKSISEETHHVALGTTSGKILIYSVSQAKVETVLSNENSHSGITSLDWHSKYGLYSCSKENSVCEWDLQSSLIRYKYNVSVESKNKHGNIRAIKIVPHKQNTAARYLVAASYQVKLWRLHDGEATIIKNLGHNAAPTALLSIATLNDVCWLIEGSQNERLLSFWDVTISDEHVPQMNGDETPHKKQRRKSISKAPVTTATPTYNFVLEDAPRLVDVELKSEDGATRLSLAAATRSGVVHYYGLMLNGSSTKPIKPSVTIQVTSADARPLPLQCCRLPPKGDLLLGYWNGPVMTFERVIPDLKTKTQILIRGEKEAKKKGKQDGKQGRENETSQVTYVEPLGGVARKRATPGDKVEVPMEARLANLALDVKGRSKSAVSQNLTKLLMQGLHSKDKGIILTVLQKDDPAVALRTVSNLPADYVPQLLEQLADMATRKTSQCASVCTWLSAVVRCHSALLLATMGSRASDHLTQLLAIFTNRRSHLCQLLNLKGRLDLTISQRSASDIAQDEQEPVLNYNDSSSDEEMEAEPYQSDSDASWGDDKFESDASAQEEADSDGD
ncbi:WD repeat-containing protein 43 [Spodoptera frugiperda]|uniref:WD repeat-containing protein 43 n=1 Tax=Spodoptera frugiperda TaxID=7108 RepID=A0A9R0DY07_SPOFR|nr:WD repeat-containing protein 43 [Spodoptera frugiperda]